MHLKTMLPQPCITEQPRDLLGQASGCVSCPPPTSHLILEPNSQPQASPGSPDPSGNRACLFCSSPRPASLSPPPSNELQILPGTGPLHSLLLCLAGSACLCSLCLHPLQIQSAGGSSEGPPRRAKSALPGHCLCFTVDSPPSPERWEQGCVCLYHAPAAPACTHR